MPPDDDEEKAALSALLTRYERLWWERERDKKIKAAVDARLAEYPALVEKLRGAFALFGVAGLQTADWEKLQERLGMDVYNAARLKVSRNPPIPEIPREAELWEKMGGDDDDEGDAEAEDEAQSENLRGTVRELVIEKLQEAGEIGAKAASLRKAIEAARGGILHEKTVGMTLYRLSQEGLARRDGRTWFYVEPSGETQNPGGETPGSINRDDKKGEEL